MGEFSNNLKHRGSDLVTKDELALVLKTILTPITEQLDTAMAEIRFLKQRVGVTYVESLD